MTATSSPTFSFGLSYRPRLGGFGWWEALDRVAVREELAQIADMGLDTLRVQLTWEQFQPGSRRIGGRAMRGLEELLDAAQSIGLRVAPVLFPVALSGTLTLPAWANGASLIDELVGSGQIEPPPEPTPGGMPVLSDGAYRHNQSRDIYRYQPLIAAQRYLVREVCSYFGKHPAIWCWQLGEGLEVLQLPDSSEAARTWYLALTEAIREQQPSARILGATSIRSLSTRAGPRPDMLAEVCSLVGVAADPPELPGEPARHTTFSAFVHALASGLADRPTIVTALGLPTTAQRGGAWVDELIYTRRRASFYADLEQQASFLEAALDRLARAGAAGIWLSAYADPSPERWREAPLDRCRRERTLGILDHTGREKPAAAAVRAFAAQLRSRGHAIMEHARQQIDRERHWHAPEESLRELWGGFEERR
jgi:hypothetical protein